MEEMINRGDKMKEYIFWTNKNGDIKKHKIKGESAKKAYEILLASGYDSREITLSGYKSN